ncbi:MAG: guanylate cyclase [bacterium]|nr:guanylate cyclase [bacterium]
MGQNNRQLAAVMFTDMVGYTALMQEDEQKARSNRDRHRKVLEHLIDENQGSILQYFGDGTLSVFDSAIQALRCALEIQTQLQRAPKIPVRIGLHVGDIVYEESGVYGDAVNVASRIESISVPGGVLFSERVFDDIKNHPEFRSNSLGAFNFKNVKRPIEVYALSNPSLEVPSSSDMKGKIPASIRRVAVLPFVNMSRDPENEYFSDGMTEELIDAFTKVDGLEVTARTSSFAFKGKNMDIREIGSQLNVDTILEGSVRKAGNRVRITAQLINTNDGYHLFSETYDRNLEDIFAVQDEIALKITQRLTFQLGSSGGNGGNGRGDGNGGGKTVNVPMVKFRTENLDAYNIYLKGKFHWNKYTPEDMKKAVELFEEAIIMAPDFAPAYSWLSTTYVVLASKGNMLPGIAYPKAEEYANKALELDDELYNSHLSIALFKMFYQWDWDGARESIDRALELNPGAGRAHYIHAIYLQARSKLDEALVAAEQAARLDPLSVPIIQQLAFIYYCNERYEEGFRQLDKMLELDPGNRAAVEMRGWGYQSMGEMDKAIAKLEEYRSMTDSELKGVTGLGLAYATVGRMEDARECLRKLKKRAQLGEGETLDMDFMVLHAALGDLDKAFYHLEKAVDARMGGLFFLKDSPALTMIRDDPRFHTLMVKAGLVE